MDWANERYVRLYTRDTPDDLVLSWQAMGLWPLLLRRADRSGILATKHGHRGIAALVRWPIDVVESALAELLEDGRIRPSTDPLGYVIKNYLEAQETEQSGAQRTREWRAKKRDLANGSVTKRHDDETKRHESVTRGDERDAIGDSVPSRAVPDLAKPSRAEPSFGSALGFDFGDEATHPATPDEPKKPKKATQLQPHWNPGPVVVPEGVDIGVELERFKDWARANGKRFVDWQAAWRNWVRKAGEITQKRGTGQTRASGSAAEAFAAFARAGES